MTFDELVAEVYILTNRPDLEAETKSAVKAATLKAHLSDFYSKDIHEAYIDLGDTPAYLHSIDYISLISNFRSLKYIRKLDSDGAVAGMISIITPEEIFDRYNATRTNVAYIAGRVIELRSDTEISKLIIACYVLPIVTENGYSSWVAALYPDVIIQEAARVVFKAIGYDEQSATFERLVAEQFTLLQQSALSDIGY